MSASPKPQEPSMEEILASIRRIIADDHGRAGPGTSEGQDRDDDFTSLSGVAPASLRVFEADEEREGLVASQAEGAAGDAEEPLMSRATDASVGQAFGVLAHTMLAGNPRPIEEVVREMLRPMLRTWLDDNLPTIVERLVRAEIERVARGGR